jgi:predicted nicotinamide N-methyase
MSLLESFHKTYETDRTEVIIQGQTYVLFLPKALEPFIDPEDPMSDFPLWAKLWKASWVLADFLAGMRPDPGKRFLEIGAGLGLVSLVGSSFGHDMTMTEADTHALAFARANARMNECPDIRIMKLDWNTPPEGETFDVILGSEVVYHERHFAPLMDLFKQLLRPGGEIILASEVRAPSIEFYKRLQERYAMKAMKKVLRSREKDIPVILCRITHRG